jgi:hypothetical protein
MKMKTVAGVSALIAVSVLLSAAGPVSIRPDLDNRPYGAARKELIKSGFRPVPIKHSRAEGEDWCGFHEACTAYPETLNCAGTGMAPCLFAFQRASDRMYVVVGTVGERAKVISVSIAKPYQRTEILRRKR